MKMPWLQDENGGPSASLSFLTIFCLTALAMWVLSIFMLTKREVTAGDLAAVAGTGIGLYGFRRGQKEGWGFGTKPGPSDVPADPPAGDPKP